MKLCNLALLLLALPMSVWADCQLTASQQKISYGRISAAERQLAQDKRLLLPVKEIIINVLCDKPQRMRLIIGSSLSGDGSFSLGDGGDMQVIASSARVDERSVRIASVASADSAPLSGGQAEQPVEFNQGIAFIDGAEVQGKTASVTLKVHSRLKQTVIREKTTWRGNLNIKLETR